MAPSGDGSSAEVAGGFLSPPGQASVCPSGLLMCKRGFCEGGGQEGDVVGRAPGATLALPLAHSGKWSALGVLPWEVPGTSTAWGQQLSAMLSTGLVSPAGPAPLPAKRTCCHCCPAHPRVRSVGALTHRAWGRAGGTVRLPIALGVVSPRFAASLTLC